MNTPLINIKQNCLEDVRPLMFPDGTVIIVERSCLYAADISVVCMAILPTTTI